MEEKISFVPPSGINRLFFIFRFGSFAMEDTNELSYSNLYHGVLLMK